MKTNNYLFYQVIKRSVIRFAFLIAFFHCNIAQANIDAPGADDYTCWLKSSSLHSGSRIFDDGTSNWSGGYTDSFGVGWNCGLQFLEHEYTSIDVVLTFSYGDAAQSYWVGEHNIVITNMTTGATFLNTFTGFGSLTGIHTIEDSSGYTLNSSTPGLYRIQYFRPGVDTTGKADITGYVILSYPIQKLWIQAPPVCGGSTSPYNFQVHTGPVDFSGIIYQAGFYADGGGCDNQGQELSINFDFSLTSWGTITHGLWESVTGIGGISFGDAVAGSVYNSAIASGYDDMNDFSISNSYLSQYLSIGGSPGPNYGTTPVITIIVNDGVITDTVTAPIVIEESVSDILANPGTHGIPLPDPSTPAYFAPIDGPLGYPTGNPNPSFNLYDYTATNNDIWTPTDNPVTRLNGGGGTVSKISIEDSLTLWANHSLIISGGLTVEMGPGAHIVVNNDPYTYLYGGTLAIDSSIVTAYRGCDVIESGGDNSTWSGVKVLGNPTVPQGSGFGSSSQAGLFMSHGIISYADTAVQNGIDPTTSGGEVWALESRFYNNKQDVYLWPYANMGVGGEGWSVVNFYQCTFVNDPGAWFVAPNFITAVSTKGPNIWDCTLTDSTGGHVTTAVMGYDAGLSIVTSFFNNFQTAVSTANVLGTHSLISTDNIFNNNNWGINASGCLAPSITGNTFYIPPCSGCTSTTYPGTDVLMVNNETIGALLQGGTTGFTLYNNIFETTTPGPLTLTTGTLESNCGGDNNIVTGNTFNGVGTAMLSNFINNNYVGNTGLLYQCNTDNNTNYDIAVLGNYTIDGGINENQMTVSGGIGYPAGNTFASSAPNNIYNQQQHLSYTYNSSVPAQNPAYVFGPVGIIPTAAAATCYTPSGPYGSSRMAGGHTTQSYDEDSSENAATANYHIASVNVHYYLTDSNGSYHRDSLYYWAGQMNSPYGDLLVTNLLIQDSLLDSAYLVYDSIITKHGLDSTSIEGNDFVQGRNIIEILADKRTDGSSILTLAPDQVATLRLVKSSTTIWAHGRAENWLYLVAGDALNDTLLYPQLVDTLGKYGSGSSQPNPVLPAAIQKNQVFPNPVHDLLQVMYTAQSNEPITIQVEDITGRTIITQSLQTGVPATIDVSKLVPGMYLYRILEGAKVTMIGKVAKD